YMILVGGDTALVDAVAADSSVALYRFLQELPLATLTCSVATVLVAVFFITSADSGALVIDMLSSRGEEESPVWQRIFWSVLVGAIAMALLAAGGLNALQAGAIAAALPFTVAMILACVGMLRAMRLDVAKREAVHGARAAPPRVGVHPLARPPARAGAP